MRQAIGTGDTEIGRSCFIGFGAIALVLAAALLFGPFQALTGDESRYLMYAKSILSHDRFAMTLAEWQPVYLQATGSPAATLPTGGGGALVMNGVYLPTVLSPIARLFGLAGLRATTLIAGLAGLFYLLCLCRRVAPAWACLAAVAAAAFSIPLLPYLHLFYMETYLFAAVCCAWYRLQFPGRGRLTDFITAIIILAIPFLHMRGSVIAASLFLALIWQQYKAGRRRRMVALILLGAAAFLALVTLNISIYGAVTGPVNSARPPWPSQWFAVLSMQAFNVHHGLLAYAPIWALGYAGLVGGAVRNLPLARQGLALAVIAALTGVGVNPGECWPARFWVLSIPMLAFGLCLMLAFSKAALPRLIALGLIAITLVNTGLFLAKPNAFLENRQTGATYQSLFQSFGYVDPGLMLPVEDGDAADQETAEVLAAGAGLIILSLAAALAWRRPLYALPAGLLLLGAIDLSRVRVVPPAAYQRISEPNGFDVAFLNRVPAGYVQFGDYWQNWYGEPGFDQFAIVFTDKAGSKSQTIMPANQVIPFSCRTPLQSVSVRAPAEFDVAAQVAARFVVYRSDSLLRYAMRLLPNAC